MTRQQIAEMAYNDYIRRSSANPALNEWITGYLEGLALGLEVKDPRILDRYNPELDRLELQAERIRAEQSARNFNQWRNDHPRSVSSREEFERRVTDVAFAARQAEHDRFPGYESPTVTRLVETGPTRKPNRVVAFFQSIFRNF